MTEGRCLGHMCKRYDERCRAIRHWALNILHTSDVCNHTAIAAPWQIPITRPRTKNASSRHESKQKLNTHPYNFDDYTCDVRKTSRLRSAFTCRRCLRWCSMKPATHTPARMCARFQTVDRNHLQVHVRVSTPQSLILCLKARAYFGNICNASSPLKPPPPSLQFA